MTDGLQKSINTFDCAHTIALRKIAFWAYLSNESHIYVLKQHDDKYFFMYLIQKGLLKLTISHIATIFCTMKFSLMILILLFATHIIIIKSESTAIKYMFKHNKVQNFSVTVISNHSTSSKTWIEYNFHLLNNRRTDDEKLSEKMLNIGIFKLGDFQSDCFIDSNMSSYNGYSFAILQKLQEALQFR